MDDVFKLPQRHHLTKGQKIASLIVLIVIACLVILGSIRLFHRGRILPGASAYGIYLGGTTREEATALLTKETQKYVADAKVLVNTKGSTPTSLAIKDMYLEYDPAGAVDQAYALGRQGNVFRQLSDELGLLIGFTRPPKSPLEIDPYAVYKIMTPAFTQFNKPVVDARLGFTAPSTITVAPDTSGTRLDLGRFLSDLHTVVEQLDRTAITARSYALPAQITAATLKNQQPSLAQDIVDPLTLKEGGRTWSINQAEILGWYGPSITAHSVAARQLPDFYNILPIHAPSLSLDSSRIEHSLIPIAAQINQPAIDAKLTIDGSRASVFQQSQDGRAIDLSASAKAIRTQLATKSNGPVALVVALTKAQVNDATIDQLGIHDLLSEGVSYFPGSSANRLTNVRVGQALYNNYLLKPDEVFSFGKILGDVGPEQGYKPGLVILGNKVASEYGGGLCQVSSTAFRAALLAGLPIVERVNHSYAVDYYTQPYGVPGVDATIYYPEVDFKFRNDTGSHILIQTEMKGTTLKFRFYGTKKKEGVIRGPNFISGSNDVNQPSKTVFYRDIVVDGKVTKTDTFTTSYKSALDFPHVN